jgi:1,4-alpha-glucan branching enzyme
VSFRVWAPVHFCVSLLLDDDREWRMNPEDEGCFRLDVEGISSGALYRFRLGTSPEPAG